MDGGIVLRDVHIDLYRVLLQVLHIEIVNPILEAELRIVQGSETLGKLRGLSVVVVEIDGYKGNESLLVEEHLFLVEN